MMARFQEGTVPWKKLQAIRKQKAAMRMIASQKSSVIVCGCSAVSIDRRYRSRQGADSGEMLVLESTEINGNWRGAAGQRSIDIDLRLSPQRHRQKIRGKKR